MKERLISIPIRHFKSQYHDSHLVIWIPFLASSSSTFQVRRGLNSSFSQFYSLLTLPFVQPKVSSSTNIAGLQILILSDFHAISTELMSCSSTRDDARTRVRGCKDGGELPHPDLLSTLT